MTLRVLHVIDSLWGGGAEASLTAYLEASGPHPAVMNAVVALKSDPATVTVANRLEGAKAGTRIFLGSGSGLVQDAVVVRDAINDWKPDVVHSTLTRSTIAASLVRGRLPHVVSLTSVDVWRDANQAAGYRRAYSATRDMWHGRILRATGTHVHAISFEVAKSGGARYRLAEDRISVVYRGRAALAPSPFMSKELRTAWGIPLDAFVVVVVARETRVKNHIAVLQAYSEVLGRSRGVVLALVGRRQDASPELDAYIARHGLQNSVLRLGHRDDVHQVLAASNLLISASLSEGLGANLIEGLAARVPIVAFDAPGVREVLGDDHPGLIRRASIPQMADAIIRARESSEFRQQLVDLGFQRFTQLFTMEAYVGQMHELYRRVGASR